MAGKTFNYKEFEVSKSLRGLINHMEVVENCRVELHALSQQWDLLAILGLMGGGNMDMSLTREGFKGLSSQLLDSLATEILKKTIQQITNKAQVAVDIVIRNLFERTADIGFLATDDDVRAFILGEGEIGKESLVERFREYVAKYSVYDNIILLDTQGRVLAQLDADNQVEVSRDPLLAEAMQTSDAYVEVYRRSDLLPGRGDSLIYAYRVTAENRSGSRPIGVLCLCFRFENEMAGVFANLVSPDDWEVVSLLDAAGTVIASSDPHHIPKGAKLRSVVETPFEVTKFGGRPYLAKTCATRGYQGFFGLGWQGHVMLPLENAFDSESDIDDGEAIDPRVMAAVMDNPRLFSRELRDIPRDAEVIQRELDRTVWNGNIKEDARKAGTRGGTSTGVLLWEIGRTGRKTQSIFEQAIGKLHHTVVSSALEDAAFIASLAIDIMDRNLYERANDCRWWALTSKFAELLGAGAIGTPESAQIGDILLYINNLYTVYHNLLVFDASGMITAVSMKNQSRLVGTKLESPWVRDILGLRESRQYAVSAFEPTPLYGGRHTFVYGAAIASEGGGVVGGIAIVFDSEPQLNAMLLDCLPRDARGELIEGAFAVFLDKDRLVISSSNQDVAPGSIFELEIDKEVFAAGRSESAVREFRGQLYAVGMRPSTGYREYKGADDNYKYKVLAMVFIPLGECSKMREGSPPTTTGNIHGRLGADTAIGGEAYATFHVGNYWLGAKAESVVEAIVHNVTKIPEIGAEIAGAVFHDGAVVPVIDAPQVFKAARTVDGQRLLVVFNRGDGTKIAMCVDRLDGIVTGQIEDNSLWRSAGGEDGFLVGMLNPGNADSGLVVVIDPDELINRLGGEELEERLAREIAAIQL